jgi:hypothetical protein
MKKKKEGRKGERKKGRYAEVICKCHATPFYISDCKF